jgi:hypothetical protein
MKERNDKQTWRDYEIKVPRILNLGTKLCIGCGLFYAPSMLTLRGEALSTNRIGGYGVHLRVDLDVVMKKNAFAVGFII